MTQGKLNVCNLNKKSFTNHGFHDSFLSESTLILTHAEHSLSDSQVFHSVCDFKDFTGKFGT